ncbi:MAG: hypothetical protein IKE73_03910 [Bacilli bacterium]|nr:hypothetical protein [Bacilli bacterium]
MKNKNKYLKISIIISIILSIIYVICDSINKDYFIDVFNVISVVKLVLYFVLFYFLVNLFYRFLDSGKIIKFKENSFLDSSKKSFIINFFIIFVINLLFLLRYYPGILTLDSYTQIKQAIGELPLSNNHSVLHTSIIKLFINMFNNNTVSIFMYMLFQIIIVSLIYSYILRFLAKNNIPFVYRLICLLFYAFHPINIFYSITLWKDILFSMFFVIFCIKLYKSDEIFINKKNIITFTFVTLLMMFLRNNGPITVYISFFIIMIIKRKNFKKYLILFSSVITIFLLSQKITFKALKLDDVSVAGALSLPTQSIARIYKYKYNELTDYEIKTIEKFYSNKIGENYVPYISDSAKALLNNSYYSSHKKKYLNLNISLIKRFPKEYLESFVSNSYGYYYMNYNYSTIVIGVSDGHGVEHKKILDIKILFSVIVIILLSLLLFILKNIENKKIIMYLLLLGVMVLSINKFDIKNNCFILLLFNIGFYSTVAILIFIYNIINKRDVTYFIPIIVLWFTILLSPVFAEFRYLYPLFLMVPIYFCNSLKKA